MFTSCVACVCRGASKTLIVLEAVWNRGVTVAAHGARNDGRSPQHVYHWADVKAGQLVIAYRVIEHLHSNSLNDTVLNQLDRIKASNVLKYTGTILCEYPCQILTLNFL